MTKKRFFSILPAVLLAFVLSGCWDSIEINKRGFVVGVALDTTKQSKDEDQDKQKMPGVKMKGTFQFIVPAGLKSSSGGGAGQAAGGGSGGGAGRGYFNLNVEESSMAAMTAMLSSRTSRSPYYEHLKLIIISQDIARNDSMFADVLDFFLRGKEMRRDMHVIIAEKHASDLLNVKPLNENYPIEYIESTIGNIGSTTYMLHSSRLGDVHERLLRDETFTVQKISMSKGAIKLTGAALFDGTEHRMVGELNGENTQGLNFLTDQIKGGIVETSYGDDKTIAFQIERAHRKLKLIGNDNGHLKFAVTINCEGLYIKSANSADMNDSAQFRAIEQRFEAQIKRVTNVTLRTLQQKFKKDAIGLERFLYQNHYRVWKQVSPNWDQGQNLFSEAEVDVTAHVKIRRIGDINESERR